jgi:hypothetical protein
MTACRPLFAFALAALTAGAAHASGINVAWNDCPAAGGIENVLFNCNVNTGNNALVVSFVPPIDLSDITGIQANVSIINEPTFSICDPIPPGGPSCYPPLPSFWDMQTGGCRGSSISTTPFFQVSPFDAGICQDMWQGQAVSGSVYQVNVGGSNWNRLQVVAAVPAGTPVSALASAESYAFRVQINHLKSTGTGTCEGCCTPVTLVCDYLQLQYNAGADQVTLTQPESRNWATWNTGNTACLTPTHNRTWGSVKALYR